MSPKGKRMAVAPALTGPLRSGGSAVLTVEGDALPEPGPTTFSRRMPPTYPPGLQPQRPVDEPSLPMRTAIARQFLPQRLVRLSEDALGIESFTEQMDLTDHVNAEHLLNALASA